MVIRALTVALGSVALSACASGAPPASAHDLVFNEIVYAPVDPDGVPGGEDGSTIGVVTVRLANEGTVVERVQDVVPEPAEGLRASYLGHTDCRRGCVGAGIWDAESRALVDKGLDGRGGFTLGPGEAIMLVLRLDVTKEGLQLVRTRCLSVSRVMLLMTDGEEISVGSPDDSFVAGVQTRGLRGPGYQFCPGLPRSPEADHVPSPASA